jgi:hypothetical protein
MNSIKIKDSNKVFAKPANWDNDRDGTCIDLHVRERSEGMQYVLESAWVPTPAELAALNSGKPLILTIFGRQMPPVMLSVEGE